VLSYVVDGHGNLSINLLLVLDAVLHLYLIDRPTTALMPPHRHVKGWGDSLRRTILSFNLR